MNTRSGAIATLVMSLLLLAVTAGAWLGSESRGVGTELPLASYGPPEAASALASVDGPEGPRADDRSDRQGGARGESETTITGSIRLRDATRIDSTPRAEPPKKLRIRSVDVSMPIVATGVRDDGLMQLPDDPRKIGWYRYGPEPGSSRGSVVLGGHVDSTRFGAGPLARLAAIEEGDAITVTDSHGELVRYRVRSVERIRKVGLPTDRLFDPESAPRLVLITCGGRYLPDQGGYEDNIVVIARPV